MGGFLGIHGSFLWFSMLVWSGWLPPLSAPVVQPPKLRKQPADPIRVVAASPVPAGVRIGSHYGPRRSLQTGEPAFHAGTDFMARPRTPVHAVRAGVIQHVVRNRMRGDNPFSGYGNAVVVYHPELDVWTLYAHLHAVSVRVGQEVTPGETLGSVGRTNHGRFPGMPAHLHFEVRRRTAAGRSPFPGPYRRNNLDPEGWLAEQGIVFSDAEDSHGCHAHALDGAGEVACDTGSAAGGPVLVRRAPDEVMRYVCL